MKADDGIDEDFGTMTQELTAPSEGASPPDDGEVVDAAQPAVETRVEALLFASDEPVAAPRLAQLAHAPRGEVLEAIDRLNVFYAETGRAFRIATIAGGFRLVTNPELAPVLAKLRPERLPTKLSRAALETLAIIAFKQPVTRAEIDAIRGVSASDRVLRHLLERKAIRIAGRSEAPGRPLLYGTTKEFLEYFGLASLTDLPRTDELAALLAGDRAPVSSEFEDPEFAEGEDTAARAAAPAARDDDDDDEEEDDVDDEDDEDDDEVEEDEVDDDDDDDDDEDEDERNGAGPFVQENAEA